MILGERSKWVPVSSQRIQQVEEKNGNFLIDVLGKPEEVKPLFLIINISENYSQICVQQIVTMDFMFGGKVHSVKCTIPADGTIRMSANSQHCITP